MGGTQQVDELRAQAQALFAGEDVFDARHTASSPAFFPFGNYLLAAACLWTANAAGLPFVVVVKWPAILADLGLCLTLLADGRRRAALLYLLSPVSLLLSTYHGQLHSVALYACVVALQLVGRRREARAGAALALAASVRQHFAVLLASLARSRGRMRRPLLLAFGAVFALVNAPLLLWTGSAERATAPALNYGGWSYDMLLLQGPRVLALLGLPQAVRMLEPLNAALRAHANLVALVWPALFALSALRRPPADAWRAAFVYVLGLYVFTPGLAVQWLVWAVPFYALLEPRSAWSYGLLAGGYILGSYWRWTLNAKHGVYSLTEHLHLLSGAELAGVILVGALGLATWGFCARTLLRGPRS